ncbi:MAG: hypothetical protein AAB897_00130 [Patescibacteria group bacterium]
MSNADDCAEAQELSEAILEAAKAELADGGTVFEFDAAMENLLKCQSIAEAIKRIEDLGFTVRIRITADLKAGANSKPKIETVLTMRTDEDE